MKKYYILFILIILIIIALISSIVYIMERNADASLVYVDVSKLIEGYHKTKTVKESFGKKSLELKTELDSLLSDWQEEIKLYEKERVTMSQKELALKKELLSNKQVQLNSYRESVEKKIADDDKKVTLTIVNDINDYLKEYGRSHGFKIIFGANGAGTIMYADESADLTEDVLKGLNRQYDKK